MPNTNKLDQIETNFTSKKDYLFWDIVFWEHYKNYLEKLGITIYQGYSIVSFSDKELVLQNDEIYQKIQNKKNQYLVSQDYQT